MEHILSEIRNFKGKPKTWFVFIRENWSNKGTWYEQEHFDESYGVNIHRYYVSMGKCPENETIVKAMQLNHDLWNQTWEQSQKGGYFIFSYNPLIQKGFDDV